MSWPTNEDGYLSLILGAGFSRAVSDQMPLTDELGNQVWWRLNPSPLGELSMFQDGYFESWLSRIAEDQPDLTLAENLERAASFARVTEQIVAVLEECEQRVLSGRCPDWLMRLVGLAHVHRWCLASFNYDTLVERTVEAHDLAVWDNPVATVTWNDAVDQLPPYPPQPARFAGSTGPTLRLLKLHGSLNTYWVPGDSAGSTINRWELFGGWGNPANVDRARQARELPGRVPFIVPPSAAKSAFYSNPISRELWQRSAAALSQSERVALVGYSLPETDLVASGMIADHVAPEVRRVDVVNRDPEPVVRRLLRLRVDEQAISVFDGSDPIAVYVDELDRELSARFSRSLREAPGDDSVPLLVAWSDERAAVLTEVDYSRDGLIVRAENRDGLQRATWPREDSAPPPLTLGDLRRAAEAVGGPIAVTFPDEVSTFVSGLATKRGSSGHSTEWAVLRPTAGPPAD